MVLPEQKPAPVSTHSRPKAAASVVLHDVLQDHLFQHTAARRRLQHPQSTHWKSRKFQHTAARRRLRRVDYIGRNGAVVSTHSRPKAAAPVRGQRTRTNASLVSTHSRPKAAARCLLCCLLPDQVSTHSRPKAAALDMVQRPHYCRVSTHSRPKAAADGKTNLFIINTSFNTQPPEGGCQRTFNKTRKLKEFQHTAARRRLHVHGTPTGSKRAFQHTAARRRLPSSFPLNGARASFQHTAARRRLRYLRRVHHGGLYVSTHSRPKAAASKSLPKPATQPVSTHSRPKAAAKQ